MASSMALRRLAGRNSLCSRPLRSLSVSRRGLNTNAQMTTRLDDDHDYDDRSVSRRRDFPAGAGFFSDVMDPFAPTRSVSQLMNLMDNLMEKPFPMMTGMRRGWDVREDDNALHLKVDMPGLGKENVKISVEENTLIIRGEADKETTTTTTTASEDEEQPRRYSSRIDLTPNIYKVDGIKAEMKNGVLKVVVPKLKQEERKDVFQVQVD